MMWKAWEIQLKNRTLLAFLSVIILLGLSVSIFGFFIVKKYIVGEVQREVEGNLKTVRKVYQMRLNLIKTSLDLLEPDASLEEVKAKIGLDYLYLVRRGDAEQSRNEVVREVLRRQEPVGATRLIGIEELKDIKQGRHAELSIPIKFTPRARPTTKKVLESAMSIEYARPLFDSTGQMSAVLYGGEIINRNFELIDEISSAVFENELYHGKPIGTVTIFQDDVRITTNVLDKRGERAVGTRVSGVVYTRVVERDGSWIDRAFVVTDWYLTAYEPIKNIQGKIIGILYVGILEKPFLIMRRNLFLMLTIIILTAAFVSVVFSYMLSNSIARPLTEILSGMQRISEGELQSKVKVRSEVKELNEISKAFNEMAEKLAQRERSLEISTSRMVVLNKNYLDLISFVSHEFKGILASSVLNVYSLVSGSLGIVNEKQRKVLDSVKRSLDHLSSTVKNFFDLSRIEKEELTINSREFLLKEDVVDDVVEVFSKQAAEKNISIMNNVPPEINVNADLDLIKIVFNNLVSNAIKYGYPNGKVEILAKKQDHVVQVEVYNEGKIITEQDQEKLFKKFSRLNGMETKRERGSGLGLFITKQIIERHNGKIWVESKTSGSSFKFSITQEC